MSLLLTFDKKPLAMQNQLLEEMAQHGNSQRCLSQGQANISKGSEKIQVAEAWKNMKSNKDVDSKAFGEQEQCHCCKHYGFPCLRNESNKGKVKVDPNFEINMDKKRKAISLEPLVESNEQASSTTLSHAALIPCQTNPNPEELEAPPAKTTPHEVVIDGWTITYKEYQPRKAKQARKQAKGTKVNFYGQQDSSIPNNSSLEYDITKDPAKRKCYHCQQEGHYIKSCPQKNQQQQDPGQDVQKEHVQGNKLKRNYIHGRLKHVDISTIPGAKEVVFGSIPVSSGNAKVLFDPSASHSFISRQYAKDHNILMLPRGKTVMVETPRGEIKADRVCPKVSLDIKGVNFKVNLIVLELMGIDVILGIDWLSTCKGVIEYAQCSVFLTTLSGERIKYEGIKSIPEGYQVDPS